MNTPADNVLFELCLQMDIGEDLAQALTPAASRLCALSDEETALQLLADIITEVRKRC